MAREAKGSAYRSDTPVQQADEDLQGSATHGQRVLHGEQPPRRGDIGERAEDERHRREREADDGEVLEVPAVGVVSGANKQSAGIRGNETPSGPGVHRVRPIDQAGSC